MVDKKKDEKRRSEKAAEVLGSMPALAPSEPPPAPSTFNGKNETELGGMHLHDLVAYNTELSQRREAAGGAEREAIYAHALVVNEWISKRAMDREENIRADLHADSARASLHQGVQLESVAPSTKFGFER